MMTKKKVKFVFLDLLKGIGIFEFILWHTFLNFYASPSLTSSLFRLMFSVTGFFVFSSGFLIGSYYYHRLYEGTEWGTIFRRLCIRACKLLTIVFTAGIIINYLNTSMFLMAVKKSVTDVFSLLYKDRWDISLQVLVSISLTLTLGYMLMVATVKNRYVNILFSIIALLIIIVDHGSPERVPYLWRYFFQGFLGIYIGIFFYKYIFSANIKKLTVFIIGITCLTCFALIEVYLIFSQQAFHFFVFTIGPQSFAVISFFLGFGMLSYLVYDINNRPLSLIGGSLSLLGKHSLFVYLLQIVIIDIVAILFKELRFSTQFGCLIFSLGLFIACILICKLLEILLHSAALKRVYTLVFH